MNEWGWYAFGFATPFVLLFVAALVGTFWEWVRDAWRAKKGQVSVTITCVHCGRRFMSGSKRRSRAMLREHSGIGNYWCRRETVPTSELIPDKSATPGENREGKSR